MREAWLILGGLTVRLTGGEGVARLMALPGFATFGIAAPAAAPDLTLQLDAALPQAEGRLLHSQSYDGGARTCRLLAEADGWRYTFSSGGSLHIGADGTAACTAVDDASTLRYAAWLAYGMLAAPMGRMPVHASAVVCHDKAVLCLGESGTGKSTHTRLWQQHIEGATLLNDDSPIVSALPDGTVEVYGSPWSGKTPCFRREHYPLAALLRLEQRPANSIRRLGTIEALTALQPSCPPAMGHDERLLDTEMQFVADVVSRTAVYRLGCLPDADAARLSHRTIFETTH